MMELTGISEQNGIFTYSYKVTGQTVPESNKSRATGTDETDQGFSDIFKSVAESSGSAGKMAAIAASKTSQSEYSQEETDAQRAKNNAIGKLQKLDGDVAALERVGPNAPEEVKSAWLDAASETGYNGMGYGGGGATRLFADLAESARMTDNSLSGVQDLLGGTVDSAIDAISSASYDRAHMDLGGTDPENARKEQAFYDSYLEKLEGLKDGSYIPSDVSIFERVNKDNLEVLPQDESQSAIPLEITEGYEQGVFFHKTIVTDDQGNGFELMAKYPEDYDMANPTVNVFVRYNGQESLYKIDINSVKPETASQTELYGLFSYIEDDKNVPRNIDPESSDIYYSGLDRKLELIKGERDDGANVEEMVNGFKSIDTLSYWDKKELKNSLYEIM